MESLEDPLGDRVMKNVPPIARDPLRDEELYGSPAPNATGHGKIPNMDLLRKHLLREGHIDKPELMDILLRATKLLRKFKIFNI